MMFGWFRNKTDGLSNSLCKLEKLLQEELNDAKHVCTAKSITDIFDDQGRVKDELTLLLSELNQTYPKSSYENDSLEHKRSLIQRLQKPLGEIDTWIGLLYHYAIKNKNAKDANDAKKHLVENIKKLKCELKEATKQAKEYDEQVAENAERRRVHERNKRQKARRNEIHKFLDNTFILSTTVEKDIKPGKVRPLDSISSFAINTLMKLALGEEWREAMDELMKLYDDSDGWRKAMGKLMKLQENSREWRKAMDELKQLRADPEWRKAIDKLKQLAIGPEWRNKNSEKRDLDFYRCPGGSNENGNRIVFRSENKGKKTKLKIYRICPHEPYEAFDKSYFETISKNKNENDELLKTLFDQNMKLWE